MDTNHSLLSGVLALQIDLIDEQQFVEACRRWTAKTDVVLTDILIESGWITRIDESEINRFVERRLKKHNGDAQASLAAALDHKTRYTLPQIVDLDVERSLVGLSASSKMDETLNYSPNIEGSHPAVTEHGEHHPDERYALTNLYAEGGIGRVWLARDQQLNRDVALKDIRPDMADNPTVIARFLNEAQITAQLEHPVIVPVYELARRKSDRKPYYAMRFLQGRTLSETVREHHQEKADAEKLPLDFITLLNAFVAICNTVAYAHSRGVVHRDLKGQNVLLGDFGDVIVLDWGLAKSTNQPSETATQPVRFQLDAELTSPGEAVGTPAYMAPEQANGRLDLTDHRTDIYGLGAILYEILTGRPPFTWRSATGV